MKSASSKVNNKGIHVVTKLYISDVPVKKIKLQKISKDGFYFYHFEKSLYFGKEKIYKSKMKYSSQNLNKYSQEYLDKLLLELTSNDLLDKYYTDCLNGFIIGYDDNSRIVYCGEHKNDVKKKIYKLNNISKK